MLDLIGNVTLGTGFIPFAEIGSWHKLSVEARKTKLEDPLLKDKFGPYAHHYTAPQWDRFKAVMDAVDDLAKRHLFNVAGLPLFSAKDAWRKAYQKYATAVIKVFLGIPEYGEEMAARLTYYQYRQNINIDPLYPFLTPCVLAHLIQTLHKSENVIEEVSQF